MTKGGILTAIFISAYSMISWGQNYPEGFNEEIIFDQFTSPAGILHTKSEIALVWELSGKVWTVTGEEISDSPAIDISEEVAFWGDHGMIGAAIDPNFLENGYVYLLYAVDRHYLLNYGLPSYDPDSTETNTAAMGRLTRFQLNTIDFQFAIPNSRHVLLGDEITNGIPICTASHGVGAVIFGEDGSLLVSTGDGNTWVGSSPTQGYNGEGPLPEFAYDSIALNDGILNEDELLGAFRSQYLDGLNGKILRIDPETGKGLANNPFFNPTAPNSPRSKIWSLGFRNPYRMTIKPGTGTGELENGFPGVIYISDVGDWVFEEINAVLEPGLNFGWPIFQGPSYHDYYHSVPTRNKNALNPLYGTEECASEYLNYQDVIIQPNVSHSYNFLNPCDQSVEISDEVETFHHERPILSYANSGNEDFPYAVIPSWDESGNATFIKVDDPASGVVGNSFTGVSGSGGIFFSSDSIPEEYRGLYLQGDFSGWLRTFSFDETHELGEINLWNSNVGATIHISENPTDGCIYLTSIWPSKIKRVCFGGNLRPIIEVTPEIVFGHGNLDIQFDASQSYDPEGQPLTFEWDFGDGGSGTGAIVSHTFQPTGTSIESFEATLTVTDPEGAGNTRTIPISLNNTPPIAEISSIQDGELYSVISPTLIDLRANATDQESDPQELDYSWQLLLHHNTHFHYLDVVEGNNQSNLIYPTGCSDDETYWYEYVLTVTDPGGLSAVDSVEIFPDCEGILDPKDLDEPLIIFPNPVKDNRLNVLADIKLGEQVEYEVYSSLGHFIDGGTIPIYNQNRYFGINLPALSSGLYSVRFHINGGDYLVRFAVANR